MVTITADECPVRECAERSILVLALLVCKERLLEHMAVIALLSERGDPEGSLRSVDESVVHEDKVIDAPYTAVSEGAVAVLQHLDERTEEILVCHIFDILLSMKVLRHARVGRVVVHHPCT